MKKLLTALLASLVLLGFSASAWAHETSSKKQPCLAKKVTRYRHHHPKIDKHKLKVLKQFKELKNTYARSIEDARQMFLEFLGSSLPAADADIQKIRDEYERQIGVLNETIASDEAQLTQANQTIASQQQQLALADDTIAAQKQQLDAANETLAALQLQIPVLNQKIISLNAQLATADQTIISLQNQVTDMGATITAKQAEIDAVTQTCDDRVADEYDIGLADGMAECPATEPQLATSWSTDPLYPYALDTDGSGNVVILDDYNMAIAKYDSNGQSTRWDLDTLQQPVDLAVDSQGAVYVLDRLASDHLQKIGSDGQSVVLDPDSTAMMDPAGLFIDSQDNIYVANMGGVYGGRVLVFNTSGVYQKTLCETAELLYEPYLDVAVDEQNHFIYVVTGTKVAKFGIDGDFVGSWPLQTNSKNLSISVGRQGQVYVVDTAASRIYQYNMDGGLVYTIGTNNELNWPYHMAVDALGRIYVGDYFNGQVKVYR